MLERCGIHQYALFQGRQSARERNSLARHITHGNVIRCDVLRMQETCRPHQFRQRFHCQLMEIGDAGGLVRHHQSTLTIRVLSGDTRRAMIGMAGARLYAA